MGRASGVLTTALAGQSPARTPVRRRTGERGHRVWAPLASSVTLHAGGSVVPMVRGDRGWWHAPRPCRHGELYGFSLGDGPPLPDPRSPSQPSGVHGLSQWVDHHQFTWHDGGFQAPPLGAAVLYELHIGTFTPEGTFDGAIARLDDLVELGISHVELMPVCEFAGDRGWGYDGVDLFAPHHAYGGPDGLKRLVDACHARGLAVVLDVVYNHAGPAGCYLNQFGPYFVNRHHTAWGEAANLDGPGSDEVRRFFCDNALMWLRDYHVDALRLDATHAFVDTSATPFVRQLTTEVAQLAAITGRHLSVIAESDLNDPSVVRSADAGGLGADAQWNDDLHHAVHAVVTGERTGYYADFGSLEHLAGALTRGFVYDGRYSAYRQRTHGAPPLGISGHRFVVALQNHDQIGNRARGERMTALATTGRVQIAAALMFTSPYVPMVFQGEEWAASTPFLYFTAHDDELGALVCEGRRREFASFGWAPDQIPDPQARATFEQSRLQWAERELPQHAQMWRWYAALIELRRERPALRDGDYRACRVAYDDAARWLTLTRGDTIVACNFHSYPQCVPVPAAGAVLLASQPVRLDADGVSMPGESVAVLGV